MSDTVRNFSSGGRRTTSRKWRGNGSRVGRFLAVLVVMLVVLLWITRDSYDPAIFMPDGLRYNVVLIDPINGRDRIAASNVWNMLPDPKTRATVLAKLRQDPGLPGWVLRNLVTGRLHLMGNDVREFSDALAITRMSRIGVLLEKFHFLGSDVRDDYAGGLRLRHIPSNGLYYAVRGRVLLISANRDALIRSLTLPDDAVLDESVREEMMRPGIEDFRGTVQLAEDDPLGDAFQAVAFAVRIDADQAYGKCHAIIRESARPRFGPLLNGARPYPLDTPLPGIIEVSANFGKPVREVWASLGEALQSPWLNAAQWQQWEATPNNESTSTAQWITSLVGPLGPNIRLSCTGVDVNEIIPVPVIIGTLEASAEAVRNIAQTPAPPVDAKPWDSYPRFNSETKLVSVPTVSGPSLEPSAAAYGNRLMISSSRSAVQQALASPHVEGTLEEEGNLFVRLRPAGIVDHVTAALRPFAELGMLRDYNLEEFDAAASAWKRSAVRVSEIVVLASGTDQAINAELRVMCAPTAQ